MSDATTPQETPTPTPRTDAENIKRICDELRFVKDRFDYLSHNYHQVCDALDLIAAFERELAQLRREHNFFHKAFTELQDGLVALGMGDGPGANTVNGLLEMVAQLRRERDAYAELAADKCTISKLNEELGQQTLCSSKQYQTLILERDSLRAELAQLRRERDEAKTLDIYRVRDLDILKEQIDSLRSELAAAKEERDRLAAGRSDCLGKEYVAAVTERDALTAERDQLRKERDEAIDAQAFLIDAIRQATARFDKSGQKPNHGIQMAQDVGRAAEACNAIITREEGVIRTLRAELAALRADKERLLEARNCLDWWIGASARNETVRVYEIVSGWACEVKYLNGQVERFTNTESPIAAIDAARARKEGEAVNTKLLDAMDIELGHNPPSDPDAGAADRSANE